MAKLHKPGEKVEKSGIYVVVHDGHEKKDHEVTCVYGEKFPPCKDCGKGVKFKLQRATKHVKNHKLFRDSWGDSQK